MVEIIGPVVMTIIIGAIDLYFMVKDLSGDAKSTIGHGLGALIPIGILTAIAFNISLLDPLGIALLSNKYITLTLLAIVGAIIVHAKSAAFKGARGVGSHETWAHSFIIAILIAASPFIYPLISTYLPI
jgi:hypothetical protein|tara:strand:+ start:1164 stop:1550 length:387 start_codon:yes stop_codon:yes gene_type:complete